MPLRCLEVYFRNRVKEKLGWIVTPTRTANITKPTNGRAPCHYCGPCHQGCVTHSYFNSSFTTVADALASGNCTLIPNAMVYQILMDKERNRARGILYIDRNTRETREVEADIVVLSAQALESVRILFNSASRQYPKGLANSSGALGHYLMDHVMGGGAAGEFPEQATAPTLNGPRRPSGIYVPRFQNIPGRRSKNFLRGYGFQGAGHSDFNFSAPGFGASLQEGACGSLHLGPSWRIWRMPRALGKLCRNRSQPARHVWHSRAAHEHEIQRKRARHGEGYGRHRCGNDGSRGRKEHPNHHEHHATRLGDS